jgi:hypothetical protein
MSRVWHGLMDLVKKGAHLAVAYANFGRLRFKAATTHRRGGTRATAGAARNRT